MSYLNLVMAAYNNCELTKNAIESIFRNTDGDFKLIFTNNGSTDETEDILQGFLSNPDCASKIDYLKVDTNEGCGIGRNHCLRRVDSDCKYIILLDNDIIVTERWSDKLIKFMEKNRTIGLAGPSTNYAGTPQLLKNFPEELDTIEQIEAFSKQVDMSRDQYTVVPKRWPVIGFCMIIRRETFNQVGLFDEEFRLYGCEDNDYCVRAENFGWRLAYIHNIFIYHHGHGGLSLLGSDGISQWDKNRKYFKQKHGWI